MWNDKDVQGYRDTMKNYEAEKGQPDDFLPSSGQSTPSAQKKKTVQRKWKPTPTADNRRPDEWMGASPTGSKPRRSWKVKSTSAVDKPEIPDDL
mmetsp:Transcript_14266/g.40609  ORF Transcript_14266/g.40609 Transcript_14266/m.40609 type:complete len:94 (+) Transcript_14266:166-447(+)|eukprot:CAMPEP_0119569222 /NCGR_PEP_ID=MMETSP1352-20130426/41048_1 /TAXON_ID=265584 /ORGANISM="Stauroneis constricta, Strain CCMP1120" /LENGTH=93 /DNA_ID=CAMNT_0007618743 /DNA_START=143 /DNA_END=424 /DNA_ORIENTATION=+